MLSVLPSNRPETFEATRLAYNTMLRTGWSQFADGLADLAGDSRIGDLGDELDGQFYRIDQMHLTNAGNAVMAAVTAPVSASCLVLHASRPAAARRRRRVERLASVERRSPACGWRTYQGEHLVEVDTESMEGPGRRGRHIFRGHRAARGARAPRLRRAAGRKGRRFRYQVVTTSSRVVRTSTVTIQVRRPQATRSSTRGAPCRAVSSRRRDVFTLLAAPRLPTAGRCGRGTAGNPDTGPGKGVLRGFR